MKKLILVGCILTIISSIMSCGNSKDINVKIVKNGKIKVEGIAENAKSGAIVVQSEDTIFYINNLREWNNKYLDKRIVVKGRWISATNLSKIDSNRLVQEISGVKFIIERARFKLR
ncbi:MAG: hypothetical protein ACJAUD_000740 [Crocinitomicaceae bacterium]|jgi:hypothetical protein